MKKQTEQLFSAFFARYPQCASLRGEAERRLDAAADLIVGRVVKD